AADQRELLRPPDRVPVAARELGRSVDGVGAAGGKEDLAVLEGRKTGDALREREGRLVGVAAESRVRMELTQLTLDGGGDLVAAVADIAVPERGGRVEVGAALAVDQFAAAPADDYELLARDLRHVGEGMPVRGGRRRGRRLRRGLGRFGETPTDPVYRPLDRLAGDAGDHALADA